MAPRMAEGAAIWKPENALGSAARRRTLTSCVHAPPPQARISSSDWRSAERSPTTTPDQRREEHQQPGQRRLGGVAVQNEGQDGTDGDDREAVAGDGDAQQRLLDQRHLDEGDAEDDGQGVGHHVSGGRLLERLAHVAAVEARAPVGDEAAHHRRRRRDPRPDLVEDGEGQDLPDHDQDDHAEGPADPADGQLPELGRPSPPGPATPD